MITSIQDALCIPYVLVVESVEGSDGQWMRRVGYPELHLVFAEAVDVAEAIDQLERKKVRLLVDLVRSGEPVPVPTPPLRERTVLLSSDVVDGILAAAESPPSRAGE